MTINISNNKLTCITYSTPESTETLAERMFSGILRHRRPVILKVGYRVVTCGNGFTSLLKILSASILLIPYVFLPIQLEAVLRISPFRFVCYVHWLGEETYQLQVITIPKVKRSSNCVSSDFIWRLHICILFSFSLSPMLMTPIAIRAQKRKIPLSQGYVHKSNNVCRILALFPAIGLM